MNQSGQPDHPPTAKDGGSTFNIKRTTVSDINPSIPVIVARATAQQAIGTLAKLAGLNGPGLERVIDGYAKSHSVEALKTNIRQDLTGRIIRRVERGELKIVAKPQWKTLN